MAGLGDNDEDEADQLFAAREPPIQRGAAAGHRDEDGALPLLRIGDLGGGYFRSLYLDDHMIMPI